MEVIEMISMNKKVISDYHRHLRHRENAYDDGHQRMGYLTALGLESLNEESGQKIKELASSIKKMDARNVYFAVGLMDGLLGSDFTDEQIINFSGYLEFNLDALLSMQVSNKHPMVWFKLIGKFLSEKESLDINEIDKVLTGVHHVLWVLKDIDAKTFGQMVSIALKPAFQKIVVQEMTIYDFVRRTTSHYTPIPSIIAFRMVRAMRKWVSRSDFLKLYEGLKKFDPVNAPILLKRYGFRRAISRIWPDLRYIHNDDIQGMPSKSVHKLRIVEVDGNNALVESSGKTRHLLKREKPKLGTSELVSIFSLKGLSKKCSLAAVLADQVI